MTAKIVARLIAVFVLLTCLPLTAQVPQDAVWIDVRTPQEYAGGHVEGAQLIPFDGIEAGVAGLNLAKETPLYLYCGSGGRAGIAKQRLEVLDYKNVVNVGGLQDALKLAAP